MEISEAVEIRKLLPHYRAELARLVEVSNNWKALMGKIPATLRKDSYECDIGQDNLAKYTSEHYDLIEAASQRTGRLCSEILFEEWGCSGRVRPSLGHLLHLLQQSGLYRAADYVSKEILRRGYVRRPADGPLARVQLNTEEFQRLQASQYQQPSENYDDAGVVEVRSSVPRNNLPSISLLRNETQSDNRSQLVEDSNDLQIRQSSDLPVMLHSKFSVPNQDDDENGVAADVIKLDGVVPGRSDLPLVSMLQNDDTRWPPKFSMLSSSQPELLPAVSALLPNSDQSTKDRNPHKTNGDESNLRDEPKTYSNTSLRSVGSPLPNMTVTTSLPHFPYGLLETATDNFNERPFRNTDLPENYEEARSLPLDGRFLGSGAFGAVYLALGLFDRPVAVKRIYTKPDTIIKESDFVCKQFKNEVELFYKYKHRNLLSLHGFSFDGFSYCLVYEYVACGNLKDRLEKAKEELFWTQRVLIAAGVAEAVSYLHTARAKPLIHRDIKTANVLLDAFDQPKLCDFGIIRISSVTTTDTTRIYGTSAYMAPEAHRGDVSVKMDTFSFGVVLLELLTGLPVVHSKRDHFDLVTHVQYSVVDGDIAPLLDVQAGCWLLRDVNFGKALYKISVKCLKEKRCRPTMIEVNHEIWELLREK